MAGIVGIESFAEIFGLGGVSHDVILKCLAAGMILGASDIKTAPAITTEDQELAIRNARRQFISKNIRQLFPGLEERFTAEQAKALSDLFDQNLVIFRKWNWT